jgi:regulator of replication initiation timing
MEALNVLEKKIASLVDVIKELKTENARLIEENTQLAIKLESIEGSILSDTKRIEELDREKALTKMAVDDLIRNIDSLVKGEKQQ